MLDGTLVMDPQLFIKLMHPLGGIDQLTEQHITDCGKTPEIYFIILTRQGLENLCWCFNVFVCMV